MSLPKAILAFAAASTLAACGSKDLEPKPVKQRPNSWHQIVSAADRDRLQRWRTAWMTGIDKATVAGNGPQMKAQGVLLRPDVALDDPLLPFGDYACRVIKMGAQGAGGLDYVAYPSFTCRISAQEGRIHFAKIDGSQRPVGDIFPDEGRRMIFLGSMSLGDETRPRPYGRDAERDMAGIVERVGPARWRIVFPYPRWESTIDIFELVPKG